MASHPLLLSDNLSPRVSQFWQRVFPANIDLAMKSIFGVWVAFFIVNAARSILWGAPHSGHHSVDYLLTALISVTATWALYRLLIKAGGRTALSVLILTVPTVLLALGITMVTDIILGYPNPLLDSIPSDDTTALHLSYAHFFDTAFVNYLALVGWGGIYLALANNRRTQAAMLHSRNLEIVTRESELRALRYQLNPHFVFNALNSVSSLIIDEKNHQAEHLVDGLADYMRAVLHDEDGNMITVSEEVAQQVRYLEIEQVRFPDRLQFEVQIDEAVQDWKIPALIIQPLIENAIKHGVSKSSAPVRILIQAQEDAGRLKISIANDGVMDLEINPLQGTGTGLSNIRERLAVIYGPAAVLLTGNDGEGMVVATIILPDEHQIFHDF